MLQKNYNFILCLRANCQDLIWNLMMLIVFLNDCVSACNLIPTADKTSTWRPWRRSCAGWVLTLFKKMWEWRGVLQLDLKHKHCSVVFICARKSKLSVALISCTYLFFHRCIIFGPPVDDALCWFVSNGPPPSLGGSAGALGLALQGFTWDHSSAHPLPICLYNPSIRLYNILRSSIYPSIHHSAIHPSFMNPLLIHFSVCPSTRSLIIYPSVHPSFWSSVYTFIHRFIIHPIFLPSIQKYLIHAFVCLPAHPSTH